MQDATHGNSLSHRHMVQLVNAKPQEEFGKEKRCQVTWVMSEDVQSLKIVDLDVENNVIISKVQFQVSMDLI